MDKITINEIVDILKGEGFKISRRTFWYYIELGLIDKPETIKAEKGVQGFYGSGILEPLRKVLNWRDAGHPLKDLKDMLVKDTIDEIENVFKKYGLENSMMPNYFTHWSDNATKKILMRGLNDIEAKEQYKFAKGQFNKNWKERMSVFVFKTIWLSAIQREIFVIDFIIYMLRDVLLPGYNIAYFDIILRRIEAKKNYDLERRKEFKEHREMAKKKKITDKNEIKFKQKMEIQKDIHESMLAGITVASKCLSSSVHKIESKIKELMDAKSLLLGN